MDSSLDSIQYISECLAVVCDGWCMNYCLCTRLLWTVMSEQNLQSWFWSRNSQNPFCYILEKLSKIFEKKLEWYVHSVQIFSVSKFTTVIVVKMLMHGHH